MDRLEGCEGQSAAVRDPWGRRQGGAWRPTRSVKERYAALGAPMTLVVPPQQGHNMWPGFFRCPELVEFVIANAGVGLVLDSPHDYQVIHRDPEGRRHPPRAGKLGRGRTKADAVESASERRAKPGEWRRLDAGVKDGGFGPRRGRRRRLVPTRRAGRGGRQGGAQATVGRSAWVRCSSSRGSRIPPTMGPRSKPARRGAWPRSTAPGGRERPPTRCSGTGGSFLPPFGDAIAERFGVPVGLVACGVGATSVREWLREGRDVPQPTGAGGPRAEARRRPLGAQGATCTHRSATG